MLDCIGWFYGCDWLNGMMFGEGVCVLLFGYFDILYVMFVLLIYWFVVVCCVVFVDYGKVEVMIFE